MSKPDDPVVFVSYRQADRPAAAREVWRALHDSLAMVVFKDDATIGVGRSINETVKSHLQRSVVLVPIIGPGWFDPRPDEVVPPVFEDDDWVRYEIRYALENDIPIVPVYVSGMRFLRAKDLPEDLRGLAARGPDSDGGFNRGVSIAGDERAERDIAAFIDKLAAEFDLPRKPAGGAEPAVAEWRPAADWELRHCERLEEQLGALRPALPPRDGPQQWPMDQVFVPLEVHTRRLGAQGESLDWERLIAADRMVLSGGPGSGKSTLLAHLALTAAPAPAGVDRPVGRGAADPQP